MTARIAVPFHPELDGRSKREESTLYVHFRHGRIEAAEIAGAVFTVGQLRAIAEASGWSWELFLEELRFKAEDQRAPFDFVPVECRYVG
jgi:predicted nucleic acid-binding protein